MDLLPEPTPRDLTSDRVAPPWGLLLTLLLTKFWAEPGAPRRSDLESATVTRTREGPGKGRESQPPFSSALYRARVHARSSRRAVPSDETSRPLGPERRRAVSRASALDRRSVPQPNNSRVRALKDRLSSARTRPRPGTPSRIPSFYRLDRLLPSPPRQPLADRRPLARRPPDPRCSGTPLVASHVPKAGEVRSRHRPERRRGITQGSPARVAGPGSEGRWGR